MNLNPFAKSNNQEDENLKNSNSDGIGLTDEAATEDMFYKKRGDFNVQN